MKQSKGRDLFFYSFLQGCTFTVGILRYQNATTVRLKAFLKECNWIVSSHKWPYIFHPIHQRWDQTSHPLFKTTTIQGVPTSLEHCFSPFQTCLDTLYLTYKLCFEWLAKKDNLMLLKKLRENSNISLPFLTFFALYYKLEILDIWMEWLIMP